MVSAADQAGYCTFAAALRTTDLMRILEGAGPFTMFAPSDAAFEKFSRSARDKLLEGDKALLAAVMGYHFAPGKVMAARFAGKHIRAVMHSGGDLIIDGRGTQPHVNHAAMIDPDIGASNGVIHGIDAVLWPKAAANTAGAA
jgi:uncharacterized surface protein with fasciclin (FAS1) repeats